MPSNSLFHLCFVLLLLPIHALNLGSTPLGNQSTFFSLMKRTFDGSSISEWNTTGANPYPYCNYTGVTCDGSGRVIVLDVSGWSIRGHFPPDVCTYLPDLRVLRLGHNDLLGGFPSSVLNCSSLEELSLGYAGLAGPVPDLYPLHRSLRVLDMSGNAFTGNFPATSLTSLTNLESVNFNMNPGFRTWYLTEDFMTLTKIQVLILSTSSLRGEIPEWIGNMTSLVDLELCGNYLTGRIPTTIGMLSNLQHLELYYNLLEGTIPDELGNLTKLVDLDMSVNHLTGLIPASVCQLPFLRVLQLYNNSLTGEIPPVIANSTTLTTLSVYQNFLTGQVPAGLGTASDLVVLELSENRLSGDLPRHACARGKLLYFLLLDNLFTGEVPAEYAACETLLRFRVGYNRLSGSIPKGLLGLPHVSIIDVSFNSFEGSIPNTIGRAANLSAVFMQNNQLSGPIPPEISWATNLVKIDLSNNILSGPIPYQLGTLKKLNLLSLHGNKLDSSIPKSLAALKLLNVLNLSNNLLTGEIPERLCDLLPNSLDFSNNRLSGPVPLPLLREGLTESFSGNPDLCIPYGRAVNSSEGTILLPPCQRPNLRKSLSSSWAIAISAAAAAIGASLLVRRCLFTRKSIVTDQEGSLTSTSSSYDITSFHKVSFDQNEIVKSLVDNNIVGHGGSGTVYKIGLSSGDCVAVKKLWSRKASKDPSSGKYFYGLDRELKSEVDTLGSIRHKNIVKLYCCFSSSDSNLLVYEYMPNGNLWDTLHDGKAAGGAGCTLDWPKRYRIALGIAQGLAYLHHDLLLPIVHRDIKTSNILLDAEYEPKVADFGIAKVLQARGEDSSTTVIAGTYGYLAPEYAYSSKATTKCDVYSFGVVLMELVSGKKPSEPEFGENKDIVHWVSARVAASKDGVYEVLDKRLLLTTKSPTCRDEMIQVLRVGLRCTCSSPSHRPSMNEVVQLLVEADGCKSDHHCRFQNKLQSRNRGSGGPVPASAAAETKNMT